MSHNPSNHDKHQPSSNDPTTGDREEGLDETLESTFPASDPPSSIPDPREGDAPRDREDGDEKEKK